MRQACGAEGCCVEMVASTESLGFIPFKVGTPCPELRGGGVSIVLGGRDKGSESWAGVGVGVGVGGGGASSAAGWQQEVTAWMQKDMQAKTENPDESEHVLPLQTFLDVGWVTSLQTHHRLNVSQVE